MSTVIVITSGKGGVGKTTASANIGAALALEGKNVVMVDTDIGLRNLDVVMGLENRIVYDLVDVVEGVCRLSQALVYDKRFEDRLVLLPAAQTRDKSAVTPEQMRVVARELRDMFEYVIIDCPAGIEQGFQNAIAGADNAIVVTNPEVSAIRDADRVIGLLGAYDLPNPKLLVNRLRPDMVRRGDMMTISDMIDVLGVELIGIVPDDEEVIKSGNVGEPVVLRGGASAQAYRDIARRILGEEVPFQPLATQKKGFFARLFSSGRERGRSK